MLLKILKSFWYHLPLQNTQTFHKLRRVIYQRFIRNLMQFRYGKIVCKDINGITYELDLSESIDASLYYSGVYEFETLKCLQHAIQQDMIVFEIGANIGAHSFEIAKLLQTGSGQLYCFEPTDYAFQKLMRNHALNHFTNIVFEKLALADQEQIQTITPTSSLDTMAFTASWDLKGGKSKNKTEQTIVFKQLDTYVQDHHIERLDLVKMDVDGYELKVIKGGLQTFSRFKPILIVELSECMLHYVGDSLEELLATLQNLGYTFQPVYTQQKMDLTSLIQEVKARQSLDCLCRYEP